MQVVETKAKSLDDALGAIVIPLTSPFVLFFKEADVEAGARLIRFVMYSQGKHRTWLWGWYDTTKDDFMMGNACRYGTPGASLYSLDKLAYQQGFEELINVARNRLVEVMATYVPMRNIDLLTFFELTKIANTRAISETAARSNELQPNTPYYLNLYLAQNDLVLNDEEKTALYRAIFQLDPIFDYKGATAADRHRIYTYYLGVIDGTLAEKDLKPDVVTTMSTLILRDVNEVSAAYIDFIRAWVNYYRTRINLSTISYTKQDTLSPRGRNIVLRMADIFNRWTRSGKLYREEGQLEVCPSSQACEILSQQTPPDPLCEYYSFGSEAPAEASLQ